MDGKELRKFGKRELLEILLSQAKRIEELENELNKTKKKLDSKKILIEDCGSLADASAKLNNIFDVAQQTAEQYLFNVKDKCKKIESDMKKECLQKTNEMIKETEKICDEKKKEADLYLANTEKKVKEKLKEVKRTNVSVKSNVSNKKKVNIKKKNNETGIDSTGKTTKIRLDKIKKEL